MRSVGEMRVAVVLCALISSSCGRKAETLARDTFREQFQCAEDIEVTDLLFRNNVDYWRTRGCGVTRDCRFVDGGEQRMQCVMTGEEAAQKTSEETGRRASFDVAAERLTIETGCARDRIHTLRSQELFKGTTKAYFAHRMQACERIYVCTVNSQAVECRVALDEGRPEKTLIRPETVDAGSMSRAGSE